MDTTNRNRMIRMTMEIIVLTFFATRPLESLAETPIDNSPSADCGFLFFPQPPKWEHSGYHLGDVACFQGKKTSCEAVDPNKAYPRYWRTLTPSCSEGADESNWAWVRELNAQPKKILEDDDSSSSSSAAPAPSVRSTNARGDKSSTPSVKKTDLQEKSFDGN